LPIAAILGEIDPDLNAKRSNERERERSNLPEGSVLWQR